MPYWLVGRPGLVHAEGHEHPRAGRPASRACRPGRSRSGPGRPPAAARRRAASRRGRPAIADSPTLPPRPRAEWMLKVITLSRASWVRGTQISPALVGDGVGRRARRPARGGARRRARRRDRRSWLRTVDRGARRASAAGEIAWRPRAAAGATTMTTPVTRTTKQHDRDAAATASGIRVRTDVLPGRVPAVAASARRPRRIAVVRGCLPCEAGQQSHPSHSQEEP